MNYNNKAIEIEHATVLKEGKNILDDITLSVKKGECLAFFGPNGSGKSSLLKLLTKDYYPVYNPEGKTHVRVFGREDWDFFELRKKVGILSDALNKFYNFNLSGRETALSGFFGSNGIFSTHTVTDKMKEKTEKILKYLDIEVLADRTLENMSSGETMRFFLARALVNEPEVLILDEPTANLDVKAAAKFLSYIEKIALEGKTVIMVTHNLPDIFPAINRVVMFKEGRIFFDGAKKDALQSSRISELFDYEIRVKRNGNFYFIEP
jgi:iron complex transport system ATP-binding protein